MPVPPVRVPLSDADDAVLAERASEGDVDAFEVLVRRFGPLMRAYARRVLGRNDDVDDVVQDTFVTAWQTLHRIDDPAKVKSWLMRIASRRAIDRIRARRDHDDVQDHDPEAPESMHPERVVEADARGQALSRALERLPEQQRRCWIMREMLGSSYDEIAADLDLPSSTVRGMLARARRSVQQEMEGWR